MKAIRVINFEPVNSAWDTDKVESLIENIKKNGWQGCPILTYGNTLITGSHRQAALRKLFAQGEEIDFDCAVDVTDIIDQKLSEGMEIEEIYDNLDCLRTIFEGTWVEEYKSEIEEW